MQSLCPGGPFFCVPFLRVPFLPGPVPCVVSSAASSSLICLVVPDGFLGGLEPSVSSSLARPSSCLGESARKEVNPPRVPFGREALRVSPAANTGDNSWVALLAQTNNRAKFIWEMRILQGLYFSIFDVSFFDGNKKGERSGGDEIVRWRPAAGSIASSHWLV